MTQIERLQSMSLDELVDWIDEFSQFDTAPWTQWFDNTYCKKCIAIMCKHENSEREFPCAYCEINGNCRFFPDKNTIPNNKEIIKMWLKTNYD